MLRELYERKEDLEYKIENFYSNIEDEVLYGSIADFYDNEYKELESELNEVLEEIKYFEFYKRTEL